MKFSAALLLLSALRCPAGADGVPDTLLHSLFSPANNAQASTRQGESVATSGNLAVVGIPNASTAGVNAGAVKVYDIASGALLHLLPNPSPAASDNFGISVAISGTSVVVGASADNSSGVTAGSVYVYELTGDTPAVPVTILNNPDPAAGDNFGAAVAMNGARLVVGAYLDNTGAGDAGSAYVYDLNSVTPDVPVATLNNPAPADSDNFGRAVAISGTRVVAGAYQDDMGATNAGSAWVYDLTAATPGSPVATLQAPNPAANDVFGISVAIDGTRVAVGAYGDDTGPAGPGRVYVFDLSGITPATPIAALNNPGPAASDRFGWSVAISGTRVVAGDWADDTGANGTGRAYAYDLNSVTPSTPVLVLDNPGPGTGDRFGTAVALSGTRVVVGASWDDAAATDAGSAYAYDLSSPAPTIPVATLNDPMPGFGDNFGGAVAISGPLMVVGAVNDDTGATNAGSAFVYDLSSSTPTVPVASLNNPTPAGADSFGAAVAVSGMHVVVGAFQDDSGAMNSGMAYVYDLAGSSPNVPAFTLANPNPAASDNFGRSVAISGNHVLVGANRDDTGATDAGSVYVFDLSSGTPTVPVLTLLKPVPAAIDHFGRTVAISGSLAAVGAYFEDTGATDAGSVYVFDLNSAAPTVPVATLHNPGPAASDAFSASLAISGQRVVAGAPNDDTGATDSGSVYVYDLSGATPADPVATLNNPAATAGDNFGWSASIDGLHVVAAAYRSDAAATDAGIAYVFNLSSGNPALPVATLNDPAPAAGDNFGSAVAISGTRVLAGAWLDDTITLDKGAAYVFVPSADVPPPAPEITVEQPAGTNITTGGQQAFLKTEPGSSTSLTFTIRNAGSTDLTGLAVTKAPAGNPEEFLLGTLEATTMPPLAATTFTMTFAPTGMGQRSVTLRIASNDADENPFEIHLTGNGPPDIAVALPDGTALSDGADTIDFGFLPVGANSARNFIIRNTGTLDLTGLAVSFAGAHAAEFSVMASPVAPVVAGNSTVFTVQLTPATPGKKTATLRIASDDPDENPFDIHVTADVDFDGSPALATAVTGAEAPAGAKMTGAIFPAGDADYYAFSAQAGDRVFAAVTTSFSADSPDSELRIIAPGGVTVLEYDNDDGESSSSSIAGVTIPTTGTCYAQVNARLATSRLLPYELWLRVQTGSPIAESEPNDTIPQALQPSGWVAGNLTSVADVDHYRLPLLADDTVFLSLDMDPERDGTTWDGVAGLGTFGNPPFFLVSDDPNAASPNSESFTMTVREAGNYTVRVAAASGAASSGTYHLNVSVRPAPVRASSTFVSADVPQTIPNGPADIISTLTIPDSKRIGRLKVLLNLSHANMPDLDVSLTAPDGNTVMLFTDIGGSGQSGMDLGLDDDAAVPVSFFTVKSGLVFQPEDDYRLGWFTGQQAQGTWTLTIRDDTAGNGGTLNSWSLVIVDEDPLPVGLPATHFSSDFEAGADGFTSTGAGSDWQRGLPAFAPITTAHSGVNCWKTNLTGIYATGSSHDLLSPPIDLTGVAPGDAVILTWAMKYQLQIAAYDDAAVEVEEVGGASAALKVWQWMGPEMTDRSFGGTPVITTQEAAGWGLHRADVTDFAGKTVRLRFHLKSGAPAGLAGLAVDDVSLISYAPAPEIAVEFPDGTELIDGASSAGFRLVPAGAESSTSFTIRNSGTVALTGLAVSFDGPHAADFSVPAGLAGALPAGGSTSFTVRFRPCGGGNPSRDAAHFQQRCRRESVRCRSQR